MRYESIVAATLAGAATAHSIPGAPQMLGGRKALSSLKNLKRNNFGLSRHESEKRNVLEARADPDQCGPGVGSCADTDCCSAAGWCGTGEEYCAAPDCQQNYGPACDSNQQPSGVDTSGADRTHIGSVSYNGAGIYDCVTTGDIAITFDDGPYSYTSDLLDILDNYNATATFFITGNNLGKGMINDESTGYPAIINRMHNTGHQIASHTWSHQNSSQTSEEQWTKQMVWNEIALNDILGFFPTYMRYSATLDRMLFGFQEESPPYSICESQCQSVLSDLGYHIVYFDLDTEGYLHNTADEISETKDILDAALASSSPDSDAWLHIEHDIEYYVVYDFMEYMLQELIADGWNMVTVGECLGDAKDNWYRTVDGAYDDGNPDDDLSVSTDGTCGSGITCLGSEFGDCCSQNGWCGSTEDYCSTGCQSDYGDCDATATATATASSTADPTSTATGSVSTDGSCGSGITCLGSEFGDCCSQHSWCGSTDAYCGTGCQSDFGSCTSSDTGSDTVSTDGTCGDGVTCEGSEFGDCCSQYGWCGSTDGHCGDGCQTDFGTCSTSGLSTISSPASSTTTSSSLSTATTEDGTNDSTASTTSSTSVSDSASADESSATTDSPDVTSDVPSLTASGTSTTTPTSEPTETAIELVTSTNGKCGADAGMTCSGYAFGILPCCSSNNKCSLLACWGSGCQGDYGTCF
ncbi:hypothetical protein MKZ38_006102 [Zalerion maritima]|uniref:Glycoside hydrolase/deacetylase n=1 Tax=Zalerion maritima TaxID=339359 RepID=A0AAD5RXN1_9PEZI|nr:hypothetical protein MKZ38_006102 [Zalerion maritima]